MKVFMFHYVLPKSNYYFYDLKLFKKTIKYLKENNKIISLAEYNQLIERKEKLDDKYVMLTFDDGTVDHYKYVYKVLKKYKCPGLFFVTSAIFKKKVLDIQIIHKIISLNIVDEVYEFLLDIIKKENIIINDFKLEVVGKQEKESNIKKLLQYAIPEERRKEILEFLSKKYKISKNTNKYYMSIKNIKEMSKNNMFFGIHTDTHSRLSFLSYSEQYNEIYNNLNYLKNINVINEEYISIAYPFGCYNEDTKKVLKELNIKYGFAIDSDSSDNNYEIKRLDCKALIDVFNNR